mmetsp:Transcript_30003/g.99359  ORF Transcript_30003/g.99359 Transcript_30003/m.99359 type:complete len:205 (+) Transcript_30003:171-785(+)
MLLVLVRARAGSSPTPLLLPRFRPRAPPPLGAFRSAACSTCRTSWASPTRTRGRRPTTPTEGRCGTSTRAICRWLRFSAWTPCEFALGSTRTTARIFFTRCMLRASARLSPHFRRPSITRTCWTSIWMCRTRAPTRPCTTTSCALRRAFSQTSLMPRRSWRGASTCLWTFPSSCRLWAPVARLGPCPPAAPASTSTGTSRSSGR